MKVLILAHEYPHALNSTCGCFVHEQVKALAEYCEVLVVSPTPHLSSLIRHFKPYWAYYADSAVKTYVEGIKVYRPRFLRLPTQYGFPFQGWGMELGLRQFLVNLKDRFDFALIHAHTVYPDGLAAAWLGRRVHTPVVCTVHGSEINIYPDETALTKIVTKRAIRAVDQLISVSTALKENTLALEIPKRKIHVIPNGVDTDRFFVRDRKASRAALGLPEDMPIVVYASRLAKAKGLSFLLSAFQTVVEREDCLLVLVGNGHYREHLTAETIDLGLQKRVLFTGRLPHAEVASWIGASDLLVLPSLSEGSPLPVYEALASGRPVVASRVGGIPEIITSQEYGLLVPPADRDALARALLYGLRKSWDHRRIREYGETYSWDNVACQLMGIYRELLNDGLTARSGDGRVRESL